MVTVASAISTLALILMLGTASAAQSGSRRVVFFGDSITELGVKEGGYVRILAELAKTDGRSGEFEFIGAGIGGNKVYDLFLRADTDVIGLKPDVVVIYVGVNDVWHKRLLGTGTDFDKFGRFYEALVKKFADARIKVVVATPAVIGERTDFSNDSDGDLNLYSKWIRDFATRRSLPLIDLRKAFLDHNLRNNAENKPAGILTTDRVHLNGAGNELVAREMWKVLREIR
jgi:lysophospholipase L1-like esterase